MPYWISLSPTDFSKFTYTTLILSSILTIAPHLVIRFFLPCKLHWQRPIITQYYRSRHPSLSDNASEYYSFPRKIASKYNVHLLYIFQRSKVNVTDFVELCTYMYVYMEWEKQHTLTTTELYQRDRASASLELEWGGV